jgi:hypothetical protein
VQKSGGAKALTKNLHEDSLKCPIGVDDIKVEVVPKLMNNTLVLGTPNITRKPKGKMKTRMVKVKVTAKKSRLEKATSHLYDLEDSCGPEKTLNIDFGLYQMEDY